MISVYFTTATTSTEHTYWLATVQGFGIVAGAMLLSFCGNYFQHWQWQMVVCCSEKAG